MNEAAAVIQRMAHPEANIIFGAVIDETLHDTIQITVVATGFEANAARQPFNNNRRSEVLRPGRVLAATGTTGAPTTTGNNVTTFQPRIIPPSNDSDLDVPTFLRSRR